MTPRKEQGCLFTSRTSAYFIADISQEQLIHKEPFMTKNEEVQNFGNAPLSLDLERDLVIKGTNCVVTLQGREQNRKKNRSVLNYKLFGLHVLWRCVVSGSGGKRASSQTLQIFLIFRNAAHSLSHFPSVGFLALHHLQKTSFDLFTCGFYVSVNSHVTKFYNSNVFWKCISNSLQIVRGSTVLFCLYIQWQHSAFTQEDNTNSARQLITRKHK